MRMAARVVASVLAAAGLAWGDGDGARVRFSGREADTVLRAGPGSPGGLELGPSDPVGEPFDTVLWHGVLQGAAVAFSARRCDAAGACTPWVSARVRTFKAGRFWARADLPAPGEGSVSVRLERGGSGGSAELELFGMEAFLRGGGGGGPAGGASPAAPGAEAERPPVVGRAAWGAKPARSPSTGHTPVRITQHHTEGRQTWSAEDSMEELRAIQSYHQEGRGWSDIGYHFIVDAEGRIFQGRPETVVGAHTRNNNQGNVGIALLGSHHAPRNHPVTSGERRALAELGRWLVSAYRIDPATYKGHRDHVSTDCPGDILYALLDEIRASWRGGAGVAAVAGPPPSLRLLELPASRLFDGRAAPPSLRPG